MTDIEIIMDMLSHGYFGNEFMEYEDSWLELYATKEQAEAMDRLYKKHRRDDESIRRRQDR